jgi:predicted RecB family nuclease
MRAGQEIGRLARSLWPGGVLIEARDDDGALSETEAAKSAPAIFEAAVQADGFFARLDALVRADDGWEVWEVKSSSRVKDEHLDDLAFQVLVAKRAGWPVVRAGLVHVDPDYVHPGGVVEPDRFLVRADLTAQVDQALLEIATAAEEAVATVGQPAAPEIRINRHCNRPYDCGFLEHCHSDRPEDHVLSLPQIREKEVLRFYEAGIERVSQIEDSDGLKGRQVAVWRAVHFGETIVEPHLGVALEAVKLPACFVDFEAVNSPIPRLVGFGPKDILPFQWSCHRLAEADGEAVHTAFLDETGGDCREAFARSLLETLQGAASIVYYSHYETQRVGDLARWEVPGGRELQTLFRSLGVDLLPIVRDGVYAPAFQGSFSIKSVLPALCPGVGYGALQVQDGDSAMAEYLRMVGLAKTDADRATLRRALLDYCELDTMAMVQVYRALRRLAKSA